MLKLALKMKVYEGDISLHNKKKRKKNNTNITIHIIIAVFIIKINIFFTSEFRVNVKT